MDAKYLYLSEFKSYGEGLQFLNELDENLLQLVECFPTESGSLVYFLSAKPLPMQEPYLVGLVGDEFIQIMFGKTGSNLNQNCLILESRSALDLFKFVLGFVNQGAEVVELRIAKSREYHFALLTSSQEILFSQSSDRVKVVSFQVKETLRKFFS